MKKTYMTPQIEVITLKPESILLSGSSNDRINNAENYYSDQDQMSNRKNIWDASNFMTED